MESDLEVGDRNSLCGLIYTIRDFADTEYQQRVWVRGEGPEVSGLVEALSELDRIDEFAGPIGARYGLPLNAITALREFAAKIKAFDAGITSYYESSDEEIIAKEGWKGVVDTAAHALDATLPWFEDNCREYPTFRFTWRGKEYGGGSPRGPSE
ncbi:MAG: hypothetical protein KGN02_07060 [bacterium]|nr:hypothetical protein [bacterium]